MLSESLRMYLLMAEIKALKQCIIDRYEQCGNFRDPVLLKLSQILDKRLNRLSRSQLKQRLQAHAVLEHR
ncbi:Spo0E family sporulation regulatory protein-aspartic acid phosphatase [Paenibacillus hamazuiensis]|uniref:Spo0E family sporulation regulatory protein-aspartic acid phosphatase n=1 Tax=Paenibacillus hamazuiensis TaxID=2936508 RepID=UPI00200E1AE2|nr:Spo0E family sporulation regulatory protein-aspartic acid phosphatase [Paenibacillus hamazuiensis]